MSLTLLLFVGLVLLVGAAGVAVGILLIGPRLDRWAQRNEEADDKRD